MERYPTSYEESMNTVLVQEIARYNKLSDYLRENIKELRKAVRGLVVITEEMEK